MNTSASFAAHLCACLLFGVAGVWLGVVGIMWLRQLRKWDWTVWLRAFGLAAIVFVITPLLIWASWNSANAQAPTAPNCSQSVGRDNYGPMTCTIGAIPRRIPDAGMGALAAAMANSGARGTVEVITDMMGCADCDGLARQFEAVFRAAPGLVVKSERNGMTMSSYKGVVLFVRDTGSMPPAATAILKAFGSVGATLTPMKGSVDDGVDCTLEVFEPVSS